MTFALELIVAIITYLSVGACICEYFSRSDSEGKWDDTDLTLGTILFPAVLVVKLVVNIVHYPRLLGSFIADEIEGWQNSRILNRQRLRRQLEQIESELARALREEQEDAEEEVEELLSNNHTHTGA